MFSSFGDISTCATISLDGHLIFRHGCVLADDLHTSIGDFKSRANNVRFRLVKHPSVGEDVTDIKLDGRCPSVESVVQSSFDHGEIHWIRKQIRVDRSNKRFRNGQFHHLAKSSRDPIAFRLLAGVAITSPIFRSWSVQSASNFGWQHWDANTDLCRPPVFIDGLQIPRTRTLIVQIAVPSDIIKVTTLLKKMAWDKYYLIRQLANSDSGRPL